MLKKVIITNYLGETAEYKIEGVQSDDASGLFITSVEGLGPVKASINMLDLATTDGQLYNSARLSGRNIVIKALFTDATSIEDARLLSYKYFPIKSKVNIKVVTDNRIGETDGYVESNEPDVFSEREGCQISILCENPYFDGGKIGYTFGDTIPLFKFQFGNESLDEPLIKLSEEEEVTDERRIVYDGDTDAGMEIAVDVPSDDIMDTFKVTGIEIQGSDGKIKIDTSKMANQVPNSAPAHTHMGKIVFVVDANNEYKYFGQLPFDPMDGNVACIFYNNEMYILNTNGFEIGSEAGGWLYKINKTMHVVTWDKVAYYDKFSKVPSVYPKGAFVYGGKIHVYYETSYDLLKHATYDSENGWQDVSDVDDLLSMSDVTMFGKVIVYNNVIHVFGSYEPGDGSVNRRHYYYYANSTWREDTEFRSTSTPWMHRSLIISFAGKIHFIHEDGRHYSWTQAQGMRHETDVPVPSAVGTSAFNHGFAAVRGNQLHVFRGAYGSNVDAGKEHYTLNTSGTWTKVDNTPYQYYQNYLSGDFSEGLATSYIYVMGNQQGYYTADPDNVCLVRKDKLVINTIKGKKSVTLYRDDNKYNVLNSLDKDPTWLQLHRGVNKFSYSAEEGADDMQITISTNKWYEGV